MTALTRGPISWIGARNNLGLRPPPVWGRAGEGGRGCCTEGVTNYDPHPQPSPQGEGSLAEFAAPMCLNISGAELLIRLVGHDLQRRRIEAVAGVLVLRAVRDRDEQIHVGAQVDVVAGLGGRLLDLVAALLV